VKRGERYQRLYTGNFNRMQEKRTTNLNRILMELFRGNLGICVNAPVIDSFHSWMMLWLRDRQTLRASSGTATGIRPQFRLPRVSCDKDRRAVARRMPSIAGDGLPQPDSSSRWGRPRGSYKIVSPGRYPECSGPCRPRARW